MGNHEVTQAEWQRVMGSNPWVGKSRVVIGDEIAASHVSWKDATNFCQKLTVSERGEGRNPVGWQYTLPTEAQWEYACRMPKTTTIFSFGDDENQLGDFAWYNNKPPPEHTGFGLFVDQRRATAAGRSKEAQSVGTVRYARQLVGMVPGRLRRIAAARQGPRGQSRRIVQGHSGWQLVEQGARLQVIVPRQTNSRP